MRNRYIIVLAVLLGLLTSYSIYDYLTEVETAFANKAYEEIIVAAGDITAKAELRSEMLVKKRIPTEAVHPQAARKTEEVLGYITTAPLVQGEQILKSKLAKPGDFKHGLAYAVPPGRRAMTMAVDEIGGVGGFLKPGDHVDLLVTLNVPGPKGEKEYTFLALQDLAILAVGKNLEDKGDGKTLLEYSNVTLAVTVEEAQKLFVATSKGPFRLLLRSPVDNNVVKASPFIVEDFLQ